MASKAMGEHSNMQGDERNDEWSKHLVRVAMHKDQQSFAALFEHFAPLLKSFYMSNLPMATTAKTEELVQEVMCKVWLKASSFDSGKSAASTWIYTVARNARIDYLRKTIKQDAYTTSLEPDDVWDDGADQPFVYLKKSRDKSDVDTMLRELPVDQRQCLSKMYLEGKSHAELALELDLPLGTVKSRIRLGLKRLQARFPSRERV